MEDLSIDVQLGSVEGLLSGSIGQLVDDIADALESGVNPAAINAEINAVFDDLIQDFVDGYESIAENKLKQLTGRGLSSEVDSGILDALDDVQDSHIARLNAERELFHATVTNFDKANAIPGLLTKEQVRENLLANGKALVVESSRNGATFVRAYTDVATGSIGIADNGEITPFEEASTWLYEYMGAQDDRNRPFCAEMIGKKLTRAEIDAISYSQYYLVGDDPTVTEPYIIESGACRHVWALIEKR